jgi:hypothetical protein
MSHLHMTTIEDVLNQLRAEFIEMPGLRLHAKQVQRLCGIEQTMCQLALDSLVASNFLCLKPNGAYARATDGSSGSGASEVRPQASAGR